MTNLAKFRRLAILLPATATLFLAIGTTVWLWPRSDNSTHQEQACWQILSELGTHSSGPIDDCGDALESGMTGNVAGHAAPSEVKKMPERQSKAFEYIISAYTKHENSNKAGIPKEIRYNLANALTYYRSDVYDILGVSVDFSDPNYSTTPNDIEIDNGTMTDFLRELAEDETAFRLIRESIFGHIERQIDSLREDDFAREPKAEADKPYADNALGAARQSGAATGILRKVRFQALKNQTKGERSKLDQALGGDYTGYGFSRLEEIFRTREESLHVPETAESKRRMEDILSTARESDPS